MARGLLAEGRAGDVARMVEPLLSPLPAPGNDGLPEDPSQILLRCLLARVRLLRHGDASKALDLLAPFEASSLRGRLAPGVRAEVALWLGWLHAWQGTASYDDALALNLLDEAERLFREELNANGRCWTLIGQALAYRSIDEYPLMLQALEAASGLQDKLQDALADLWLHELGASGAFFEGRYAEAQQHLEALQALGQQHNDPLALGRAQAYRARLGLDLGRAPQQVIEDASEAGEILSRSAVQPGYPLAVAHYTRGVALLRAGCWDEAAAWLDHVESGEPCLTTSLYLSLLRARLYLLRDKPALALGLIDEIAEKLHRHQHRLLATETDLLRGAVMLHQDQHQEAQEALDRAYRYARETGFVCQLLRVLLQRAEALLAAGDTTSAQCAVREAEHFGSYFSVLPFAAARFRILGHLALAASTPGDARSYFAQALSAYSLIGYRYRTAQMQLELAKLSRDIDAVQTRPLLEAAQQTFMDLQVRTKCREAKALLRALPAGDEAAPAPDTLQLGASLARAALSVELVAEALLQSIERLLPDRWLGVFRCREGGPWMRVQTHGNTPPDLPFPSPEQADAFQHGVRWLRLRAHPGPAFFLGVAASAADEPAWQVAAVRLSPWLPVVTLALEHALLRAQRLDTSYRLDLPLDDEVKIPLKGFIYASPAMRDVAQQIHRIRASHSPVLITGESGSGKELIAHAVHQMSERKQTPFVAFNCSNVPHDLFDSHLFGHEKGAFTGANKANPGVIRAADGGTLFLDEIGDLPLDVQPKLLRFLQEGEIFPLGARRPVRVNVRVIAATNQNLEDLIREGRFREDLFYRLNVIPLRVPPLRDRREEIPLLIRHFLQELNPSDTAPPAITNRALEVLLHYDWPGNVRQLRNEIERILVFVNSEPAPTIDVKDLTPAIVEAAGETSTPAYLAPLDQILQPDQSLDTVLADTERVLIERVLARHQGQVSATAEALGLTRQGLYKKMKRLGIDASRFQAPTLRPGRDARFHLN